MENIEEEYSDRLTVIRVNIEESREALDQFFVISLPTFIVFIEGRPTKRLTGVQTKNLLLSGLRII